jgi:hypothetical protein
VYATPKSTLNNWRGVAALLVVLGIGALVWLKSNQSPVFISAMCGLFALLALVYTEVFLARRRLTITATEVEYRTATGVRRLSLSAIKGFRYGADRHNPSILLVPSEAGAKALNIPLELSKRGEIALWAEQHFPNLLTVETKADLERILADDAFGFTPEERRRFYDRQQLVFKILVGTSIAGMVWAFIPRPYEWCIGTLFLTVLASMASGVLGRGLMTLWGQAGPAHPAAGIAIGISSSGLILRSFVDFEIESWATAATPICALTFAWAVLLLLCFRDARKPGWEMGSALILALLLGFSSTIQYNGLFPQDQSTIHETVVLDKNVVHGKSTTWKVYLEPWNTHTEPVKEDVKRDLYEAVEPGDTLWVWVQPGALNIPWRFVTLPEPQ